MGDSRCYKISKREIDQITCDQTVAQELVDQGVMDPETAERSRYNHVLSRAVGINADEVVPTVTRLKLQLGESLLLCSDGLTKHLGDEDILRIECGGRSRGLFEHS